MNAVSVLWALMLCSITLMTYSTAALPHDPLPSWQGSLPTENFDRPAEKSFDASDYVFKFDQLGRLYRVPGEFVSVMFGDQYGFDALSIFVTETHPNGGPRLHTHDVEEAHVLLEGSVEYIIGDKVFTVEAPYIAKVPANVPHTFMNTGNAVMHIIAAFPSKRPSIKVVGPNPLVPKNAK